MTIADRMYTIVDTGTYGSGPVLNVVEIVRKTKRYVFWRFPDTNHDFRAKHIETWGEFPTILAAQKVRDATVNGP